MLRCLDSGFSASACDIWGLGNWLERLPCASQDIQHPWSLPVRIEAPPLLLAWVPCSNRKYLQTLTNVLGWGGVGQNQPRWRTPDLD